jgi:hypothetical protein
VAVHKGHRDICFVEQDSEVFREFLRMAQAIVDEPKPQSIPILKPCKLQNSSIDFVV